MKDEEPLANWGENIRWSARVATPDDVDEVAAAITSTSKLTVLAQGHSFSRIVQSDPGGVTVLPGDFPALVGPGRPDERDGHTRVHIQGQVPVGVAFAKMNADRLALSNSGSNQDPSVIGAVATAVHGSDPRFGSISHRDNLRAIWGIDGTGRRFELDASRSQDESDLTALRAHLGAFGFIGGVQLAARHRYNVVTLDALTTLDEALDEADAVRQRAARPHSDPERYEAFWFPGLWRDAESRAAGDPLWCITAQTWKEDTDLPVQGGDGGLFRELVWGNAAIQVLLEAGHLARRLLADGDGSVLRRGWEAYLDVSAVAASPLIESWHDALVGPRHFHGVSLEYALPLDALRPALLALHDLVVDYRTAEKYVLDLPVNLRWTAGDEGVCMSPAHRGPTAWVDLTCSEFGRPAEYGPFLREAETILVEHGGLPHLGKAHWVNPKARWDPELWTHFWEVRQRFDPDERFLNRHLAALREGRDLDPGL